MPFNCSSKTNAIQTPQAKQYYATRQDSAQESREYLLNNAQPPSSLNRPGRPASVAPSIASVLSDTSTIVAPTNTYRGFPSREAYMEALNQFIESKMYMSSPCTLTGFYGRETMDEVVANRPDIEFAWQKRRKAKKAEKARRMTVAPGMETLPEESPGFTGENKSATGSSSIANVDKPLQRVETNNSQEQGKMRRLSRVFTGGRRATVS